MRTILLVPTGLLLAGVTWAFIDRQQSVKAIDATMAEVREELRSAEEENTHYTGGLVKALIQARIGTYQTTLAMLQQKRASLLHRLDLRYCLDLKPFAPESADTITALEREIEEAKAEVRSAELEAHRYAGGLVLALIEARRATAEQRIAILELRLAAARYGLPSLPEKAIANEERPAEGRNRQPEVF